MAKYRHRVFEMYDFYEEAAEALAKKSTDGSPVDHVAQSPSTTSADFDCLVVSDYDGITRVTLDGKHDFDDDRVQSLRLDLANLKDALPTNCRVVFDFTGVDVFHASCIELLKQFTGALKMKGSRVALCCLNASAKETFFSERVSS